MPSIGNPNAEINSFKKIGIYKGGDERKDLGTRLNEMSGRKEVGNFVDRKTHNKLGKDGFLKLLSHQLANQDPMTPMDQKRFAADLAQFSQLEQLANINTKMKKSSDNIPVQNKFYGASFIGKKVLTDGTTISYKPGDTPLLPFHLDKRAVKAMIRIYDESNNIVRRLDVENLSKGNQMVKWDGRGEDNNVAVGGIYRFDVLAFDEQYARFQGKSQVEGVVTGVNFDDGETTLVVDHSKKIALRDVRQFQVPDNNKQENVGMDLKKSPEEAYNKNIGHGRN